MTTTATRKLTKKHEQEILDWVNKVRATREMKPVTAIRRGRRGSFCECPIARTLHANGLASVDSYKALVRQRGTWFAFPLPDAVTLFIELFDRGELPEFEVRK